MGVFFGTDGIRGIVNNFLTRDLTIKCGNAVAQEKNNAKILIGGDTRITREFLTDAFSVGAMSAGADVVDIGVCPTSGIAYITSILDFDYGVVVSASHNPAKYNGIKVFDEKGVKLGDKKEDSLERRFIHEINNDYPNIGSRKYLPNLTKKYEEYLKSCCNVKLNGLTIVIDGSNGASYKIAPSVFRDLGAKVIAINCHDDGENINNKCGSMYPEKMCAMVKKYKADIGFAFDGDADRIIACDENGSILDGDIIIFMLAKYLKELGKLSRNIVVGTRHTNMGIEKDLEVLGIKLIRTDIGDKYVIARLEEENLNLGGEKSGHIIFRDYATTGDGILTGVKLAEMIKTKNKKVSELAFANLFPQINIDCVVSDKAKVINSEILNKAIERAQKLLGDNSRIMVRMSGTEPKIRIMVESKDEILAQSCADDLEKIVAQIDREFK